MNLPIEKNPRVLAPDFIKWVKTLVCIVCQGPNPHPHHIIGHGLGGGAMKADDYLAFPLCGNHHTGDEGVHKGHESWEWKWGCQMKMAASNLILAYSTQVITKEICQKYIMQLEPYIGMDYINQRINYFNKTIGRT